MRKEINCNEIAKAIGPYSHSVMAEGKFLFLSGQVSMDSFGNLIGEDIQSQTLKALENLKSVVETAGGKIENIVKTTVLMQDLSLFTDMNKVYAEFFGETKPARATFEVSRLPKDAMIEIEAIAVI